MAREKIRGLQQNPVFGSLRPENRRFAPAGITRAGAARGFNQPAMDAISELKAENARLRARLEMGIGVGADGKPVAIPDEYDGIFARDETIRLQDAELTRLRRQNRRLRRKLARAREAWGRVREAAQNLAKLSYQSASAKIIYDATRAAKVGGEDD